MNNATVQKENRRLTACFEWLSVMIGALVAVIVIFAVLFRVVTVSGESMLNTLRHNDRLILVTEFYKLERGDIVVICREGEEPLIKRVIALAGDTVDIDDESGSVLLNGMPLSEEYVRGGVTPSLGFEGPYTVKDGEVFAMGDNRQWSKDSRYLGAFSVDDVVGEAVFRVFPLAFAGGI